MNPTLTSLLELAPGPTESKIDYGSGQTLGPAAAQQAAQMLAEDTMGIAMRAVA